MQNDQRFVLIQIFRLYYFIVLATVGSGLERFFGRGLESNHFTGTLEMFSSLLAPMLFDPYFIAFGFSTLFAAAFPQNLLLRILHTMTLWLCFSLMFSFGKTNFHSYHVYFYVSFALIFLSPDSTPFRQKRVVQCLWAVLLMNYTTSGLWKIKGVYDEASLANLWADVGNAFAYHFAYAKAEGTFHPNNIQTLLMSWPSLGAVTWLSVIILETFSFLSIFWLKIRYFWVFGLATMHFIIGISMGIWFVPAIIMIGLLTLLEHAPFSESLSE